MTKQCPNCGSQMVFRPAGISKKTGKAYAAFLSCPNRACNHTENIETPPNAAPQPVSTYQGQPSWSNAEVPPPAAQPRPEPTLNDYHRDEENKQLRIARESVLSTLSNIMEPQKDLVVGARNLCEAADVLMKYVYTGKVAEDLSDQELAHIEEDYAK